MIAKLWTIIPACALIACGSHAPPKDLVDARAAYAKAEAGPASKLVPAELHVAHESLDAAEHSFHESPDSQDTVDISYVALRKAERADALGRAAAAEGDRATADRTAAKTERAMLENTQGRLQKTQGQLERERNELAKQKDLTEAERKARVEAEKARIEAEKKAQDAMDALAKSMAVKNDTRGTVITLSGGLLFATGASTLLPGAQTQLNQVGDALKTQAEHHFVVEGHTDNQGTDKINDELSTRRANAVRDYLIVRGVSAAAITAQGFGSTRPIGDNKTTEGRAMNRRVEIIVGAGS
jgi:outer membrane protein OmpA-like peptidoglycan-associated protein